MIMTDQDHDGSHIKGLIMNYFHTFYPSLLRVPGFLIEFITPVIKVSSNAAQPLQQRPPLVSRWPCIPQTAHSVCHAAAQQSGGQVTASVHYLASSLLRYSNM